MGMWRMYVNGRWWEREKAGFWAERKPQNFKKQLQAGNRWLEPGFPWKWGTAGDISSLRTGKEPFLPESLTLS